MTPPQLTRKNHSCAVQASCRKIANDAERHKTWISPARASLSSLKSCICHLFDHKWKSVSQLPPSTIILLPHVYYQKMLSGIDPGAWQRLTRRSLSQHHSCFRTPNHRTFLFGSVRNNCPHPYACFWLLLVVLCPLLNCGSTVPSVWWVQPPILMASKKNKESRLNRTYIIGFKNLRGVPGCPSKRCDVFLSLGSLGKSINRFTTEAGLMGGLYCACILLQGNDYPCKTHPTPSVESKGPVLLNWGWDDRKHCAEDDGEEQDVPVTKGGGSSGSATKKGQRQVTWGHHGNNMLTTNTSSVIPSSQIQPAYEFTVIML